jgi:hypothetical protein
LLFPAGLTFGPKGDLYVSSAKLNAVLRYNGLTGEYIGTFAAGGGLMWPVYLAFGPDGDLYVAGRDSDAVHRYRGTNGEFVGLIGESELVSPEGIAFDRQGHLHVSSSATCRLYEYDTVSGRLLNVRNQD